MLSYCNSIAFTPPFYSFHFLSTPSLTRRVGVGLWAESLSSGGTPSLTGRVGEGLFLLELLPPSQGGLGWVSYFVGLLF